MVSTVLPERTGHPARRTVRKMRGGTCGTKCNHIGKPGTLNGCGYVFGPGLNMTGKN